MVYHALTPVLPQVNRGAVHACRGSNFPRGERGCSQPHPSVWPMDFRHLQPLCAKKPLPFRSPTYWALLASLGLRLIPFLSFHYVHIKLLLSDRYVYFKTVYRFFPFMIQTPSTILPNTLPPHPSSDMVLWQLLYPKIKNFS